MTSIEKWLEETERRECEALHPMAHPGSRSALRACAEDVPKMRRVIRAILEFLDEGKVGEPVSPIAMRVAIRGMFERGEFDAD